MDKELQLVEAERQAVVFRLGDEHYGIEIARVNEIIRMRDITPIPGARAHVEGLINLRGKTVPVVDLRTKLGLDAQDATPATRIVVVETGQDQVGIIVDAVTEVLTLATEQLEDRPELVASSRTDYVSHLAKKDDAIIALLDLDQALAA